jgi:predicted ABC-type sugar transport system permease subunit
MANTVSERANGPDTGLDGGRTAWHARGFFASQTAYVSGALVIIIVVMAAPAPAFLTLGNLVNIAANFSYIAIVSLGATLVILTAGIDLSGPAPARRPPHDQRFRIATQS